MPATMCEREIELAATRVIGTTDLLGFIAAAQRAPSGDNLQPWRFIANAAKSRIDVFCETQRDLSPMNAGQRMSHIACGAAIENILTIASAQGWQTELEVVATSAKSEKCALLARIHFIARQDGKYATQTSELINARVTNRRLY